MVAALPSTGRSVSGDGTAPSSARARAPQRRPGRVIIGQVIVGRRASRAVVARRPLGRFLRRRLECHPRRHGHLLSERADRPFRSATRAPARRYPPLCAPPRAAGASLPHAPTRRRPHHPDRRGHDYTTSMSILGGASGGTSIGCGCARSSTAGSTPTPRGRRCGDGHSLLRRRLSRCLRGDADSAWPLRMPHLRAARTSPASTRAVVDVDGEQSFGHTGPRHDEGDERIHPPRVVV